MRDPKTHAKVLALRVRKLSGIYGPIPDGRPARIKRLYRQLRMAIDEHEAATGWFYAIHGAPRWMHTEIIPDTEEEA